MIILISAEWGEWPARKSQWGVQRKRKTEGASVQCGAAEPSELPEEKQVCSLNVPEQGNANKATKALTESLIFFGDGKGGSLNEVPS